ncbi:MAG: D-glycero-beta-D-manno-heptose 1-phosphate adenylyltransferase [Bdellovibrionota bacterium]|nr:D-glycero-beta-D-manno-heptose 1-phosphate adenylyltransferase [Bdellovibrionota bacterium]
MGRVVSTDFFQDEFQNIRGSQKVVFTNGCFDLLHAGHVAYLQEAKEQGDLLVLGLNSDSSVSTLKGPTRPIQKEDDRAFILAGLACIDYVCLFSDETPIDLIKAVKPDVLVKGGDWKPEQIVGSDFVLERGGEVKSLKFVEGRSTTNIVEIITQQVKESLGV